RSVLMRDQSLSSLARPSADLLPEDKLLAVWNEFDPTRTGSISEGQLPLLMSRLIQYLYHACRAELTPTSPSRIERLSKVYDEIAEDATLVESLTKQAMDEIPKQTMRLIGGEV